MNNKLILLAALALGGCTMTTGSTLAQLQASTWQLQGASGDTFTLQVAGDYLQTLEKVASFQVSGKQLVLKDADKATLLTFDAVK